MAAASVSKTGKLGFVAANPFGVVIWTVNAYELGAQKINPNATVNVIDTGAWNDPVTERAAAAALIDQGADVIGQHVDTPTPQIVVQERSVHGTGHHRNLRAFVPKATVCSSVWVWDRFLVPELKKVMAGDWTPQPHGAFIDTLAFTALRSATLATAFAPGFAVFAFCRFVTGMGIGGEYAAINSAVDELIPARLRGRVNLAINGSFWLGAAAALVLLAPNVLGPVHGWRACFALGALLAATESPSSRAGSTRSTRSAPAPAASSRRSSSAR